MKKGLLLLCFLISTLTFGQEKLNGRYSIKSTSDAPYNKFNQLNIQDSMISFLIEGEAIYNMKITEIINENTCTVEQNISDSKQEGIEQKTLKFKITWVQNQHNFNVQITSLFDQVVNNIQLQKL